MGLRFMDWLNYHHLLYFWTVARVGSVGRACEELRLAQPTISKQIHAFEQAAGHKLFSRVGRHLVLTETGQVVFRYAEKIFGLGQELNDVLKGQADPRARPFVVGLAEAVPKFAVYWLLRSTLTLPQPIRLVCVEGTLDRMVSELVIRELDLVISDSPASKTLRVKVHNKLLGESGVSLFASRRLAAVYRRGFPLSLQNAPFLLPTRNAALRRSLDGWFIDRNIHPDIVGEFDDMATLMVFGQAGSGVFPASSAVEKEIVEDYRVGVVGRIEAVRVRLYAITLSQQPTHPAIQIIADMARKKMSN